LGETPIRVRPNKQRWLHEFTGEPGRRLLRQVARYLVDRQQAEDLAQEVYLRLLRVDDDAIIREPRAFALRVAANVAHEWRSLARNRYPHSSDAVDALADGADAVEIIAGQERVKRLNAALQQLSPDCRAALLMHRRDKMSREQIAETMGISVGMVKKHLVRALTVCRQYQAADDENKEADRR
jgi:RNA polymerase sigma factor (sigma-70 family)